MGRGSSGFGPISLAPIHVFQTVRLLHGIRAEPWELRAVLALDQSWMVSVTSLTTVTSSAPPPEGETTRRKKKGA